MNFQNLILKTLDIYVEFSYEPNSRLNGGGGGWNKIQYNFSSV